MKVKLQCVIVMKTHRLINDFEYFNFEYNFHLIGFSAFL